jgi:UDP-N-acetyl-D-galactosamine dehydrogenase
MNKSNLKICVVGLGYVGLPLAHRFSLKGFDITGFDISAKRIEEIKALNDINDDIEVHMLNELTDNSKLTSDVHDISGMDIYIITVPTPIKQDKTPNLDPVINASKLVGNSIKEGSIVIYESTVYPGVTDGICTPILEEESGLDFNKNFYTGYSPERIVPGDKINTIEKIKKVVSASDAKALEIISFLYSSIIDAGIHVAPSIKVAEASKITENVQRDVNIALVNELHQIFTSLDINTIDVIEAASTKWNFMKLTPGLVGGHCISVDPYYLMHRSMLTGYMPNIMRSAREVNEGMGQWVLGIFLRYAQKNNIDLNSKEITFFGYTFKENCNDIRNTKVLDLILAMKSLNIKLSLWDPLLEKSDIKDLESKGIKVHYEQPADVDFAFICVYHDEIMNYLETYNGPRFDYKNILSK